MSIPAADMRVFELVHTGDCGEAGSDTAPIVNVYHYRRTAYVNAVSKSALFTAWKAAIGDKVILALNNRYTSQNVKIRCLNDYEDPFSVHAFTDVGAVAGQSITRRSAAYLNLQTATRGPWARGSKHYGPLNEADTEGEALAAGAQTLFNNIGTAIENGFTDATPNTWKSVIVSKTYSTLDGNPTTLFTYDITQAVLNVTLGTMKGRRVRTVV